MWQKLTELGGFAAEFHFKTFSTSGAGSALDFI